MSSLFLSFFCFRLAWTGVSFDVKIQKQVKIGGVTNDCKHIVRRICPTSFPLYCSVVHGAAQNENSEKHLNDLDCRDVSCKWSNHISRSVTDLSHGVVEVHYGVDLIVHVAEEKP